MALITGTPAGVITAQDNIYLDSAPNFYFQDNLVQAQAYLNNPDGDGFYWNLTGSAANPIYQVGCYEGFQMADQIEMSDIRCDTVGSKGSIQKRNFLDLSFTLKTLFPLEILAQILRWGTVTTTVGATEKVGIGQPNNQKYFYAYFPVVYDPTTGDYVSWTVHRAQWVDSTTMSFAYGQPTTVQVMMRCFADEDKPSDQLFATVIRADPSAI